MHPIGDVMRFSSLLDSPVRARKVFDAKMSLSEANFDGSCRVRVFREPGGGSMLIITAQDVAGARNIERAFGSIAGRVVRDNFINPRRVLFMNHHLGKASYDIVNFDVFDGTSFLCPTFTGVR